MSQFRHMNCPACYRPIDHSRVINGAYYCACGWKRSMVARRARLQQERGVVVSLLTVALVMVASAIHLVNWDKFAFTVIEPLVKHNLNVATSNDYKELLNICEQRKQLDCQAYSNYHLYERNPAQNLANLAASAKLYLKIGKNQKALVNFGEYFSKGGADPEAGYHYAMALADHKMFKESKQYFKFSMANHKADRLPRVTRAYVSMLMKWNKWRSARHMILGFRQKNRTALYFMESELQNINRNLTRVPAQRTADVPLKRRKPRKSL